MAVTEVFIIDHSLSTEEAATARGDMLYRWGNSANYGIEAPRTLFGQHNCHWIPAGHPGAGHVLCFNNGGFNGERDYTAITELELPPRDGRGYALGGAASKKPVAEPAPRA